MNDPDDEYVPFSQRKPNRLYGPRSLPKPAPPPILQLTVEDARSRVTKSVEEFFIECCDGRLLNDQMSERMIVRGLRTSLQRQFRGCHVAEPDYSGGGSGFALWTDDAVDVRQTRPDITVDSDVRHLLVVEVKKSTNRNQRNRDNDSYKLAALTSVFMPDKQAIKYDVGLFVEIGCGRHVEQNYDQLWAYGEWYVDGHKVASEVLCDDFPLLGPFL